MISAILLKYWKPLALILLLAGGLFYVHQRAYNRGQADTRAEWEAANREAASKFAEALQDQQETLIKADDQTLTVRRDIKGIEDKLDEALKTPEGNTWGNTPLPDGVRLSVNAARDTPVPPDP